MPKDLKPGTKDARDWILAHVSHLTEEGNSKELFPWSDGGESDDSDSDGETHENTELNARPTIEGTMTPDSGKA
jgi:hypothetical protein